MLARQHLRIGRAAVVAALMITSSAVVPIAARATAVRPSADCALEGTGAGSKPDAYQTVAPTDGFVMLKGTITCTGTWRGEALSTAPGTFTMSGRPGTALGNAYGASCLVQDELLETEIVLRTEHRHRLRITGTLELARSLYWSTLTGDLDGLPVSGYAGWGADPDEHDGTCGNPADPFHNFMFTGRILVGGPSASGGIDHQVVVAWPQEHGTGYVGLPTQFAGVAGNESPLKEAIHVYDYPVLQGDTITWTNADATPHSITSCAEDCDTHVYPNYPTPSGTFKGEILTLGSSWTLDTAPLAPGTYKYYCEMHRYMRGSFEIMPASATDRVDRQQGLADGW